MNLTNDHGSKLRGGVLEVAQLFGVFPYTQAKAEAFFNTWCSKKPEDWGHNLSTFVSDIEVGNYSQASTYSNAADSEGDVSINNT